MKKKIKIHIWATILLLVTGYQGTTFAESRNCTALEKKAGDQILINLSQDADAQLSLLAKHMPFGLHEPAANATSEQALYQNGYILMHDGGLLTTLWTSYRLTNIDMLHSEGRDRVNCFRKDPRLDTDEAATPTDYKEPIFDQGHMTNDADLKDILSEQLNTYVMSNMSPQFCRFNRGIWLSLEHLTRKWAKQYGNIYVTSGAIFDRDGQVGRDADDGATRMVSRNGNARVAVPSHYYKNIMRFHKKKWHTITFILPHVDASQGTSWDDVKPEILASVSSMDLVEGMTGVRLHPALRSSSKVEYVTGTDWDLSSGKSNFEGSCN